MTDASGRLPTFLVIGAMKSGTSSLREYLRHHPDVWLPPADELHFFNDGGQWSRGVDWYRAQFAGAGAATAVGEKSPTYAMHPEHRGVPARVAALIPDVRLVYVVRHPVDRLVSHWIHNTERGDEHRSLGDAVRQDPRYVDTSRYAHQLSVWSEEVDRDQLLVLTADELDAAPERAVTRVARHLGVDPGATPVDLVERLHRSSDKAVPGAALAFANRIPGFRSVKDRLPAPVRRIASRVARRPVADLDITVDDALGRYLAQILGPDVEALASWLDRQPGWSLER